MCYSNNFVPLVYEYPVLQECNNIIMLMFQDIDDAKDYFKRKFSFLEEQIEKIMQLYADKNELSKSMYFFYKRCDLPIILYMKVLRGILLHLAMIFTFPCNCSIILTASLTPS
jgi:hypothetical protein